MDDFIDNGIICSFPFLSAQALEDAFTLYFSHWAVEGILIWGFWDGKIFNEHASLVEGPDVTVGFILILERTAVLRERPPMSVI